MKVFFHLRDYEKGPHPIATIGTFDGVHLGHRRILETMTQHAHSLGGESVMISFHPHPRLVLFPEANPLRLLQTLDERIASLEALGIDKLMLIPFTREFSRLTSAAFVKEVLVDTIGIKRLVIGYDHHFGKNRTGNVDELRAMGPGLGFEVDEIPALQVDDVKVSSTKIRTAIQEHTFKAAAEYLGYPYSFSGEVIHGEKLGRTLGFPTANLQLPDPLKLIPGDGVYLVAVQWEDRQANGLLSIGTRPTVGGLTQAIEVYLFDFQGDLYGKTLRVTPLHAIRGQQKFSGKDELVAAMHRDEAEGRRLLLENAWM